jgi:hypothetical protein
MSVRNIPGTSGNGMVTTPAGAQVGIMKPR